jgi:hypothetical protein
LKDIRVNHSITLSEMIYAGVIRVPIGIIAASVVILLVEGDWFPLNVGKPINPWLYCLLGFVAGFSETFVPNMFKQIEARTHAKSAESGSFKSTAESTENAG